MKIGPENLDKIFWWVLSLGIGAILGLSLVGCGKDTEDPNPNPSQLQESCIHGFKYQHNGAYWIPKMGSDGWQERCIY